MSSRRDKYVIEIGIMSTFLNYIFWSLLMAAGPCCSHSSETCRVSLPGSWQQHTNASCFSHPNMCASVCMRAHVCLYMCVYRKYNSEKGVIYSSQSTPKPSTKYLNSPFKNLSLFYHSLSFPLFIPHLDISKRLLAFLPESTLTPSNLCSA